jgi:hypothetical protein
MGLIKKVVARGVDFTAPAQCEIHGRQTSKQCFPVYKDANELVVVGGVKERKAARRSRSERGGGPLRHSSTHTGPLRPPRLRLD